MKTTKPIDLWLKDIRAKIPSDDIFTRLRAKGIGGYRFSGVVPTPFPSDKTTKAIDELGLKQQLKDKVLAILTDIHSQPLPRSESDENKEHRKKVKKLLGAYRSAILKIMSDDIMDKNDQNTLLASYKGYLFRIKQLDLSDPKDFGIYKRKYKDAINKAIVELINLLKSHLKTKYRAEKATAKLLHSLDIGFPDDRNIVRRRYSYHQKTI